MHHPPNDIRNQRGAALIVSLVMLAALTMISMGAVDSAILGMHIARNTEEKMNAFQTAQSAVDVVISDTANLPMTGPLNTAAAVTLSGSPFVADTGAGETITADAARTTDCGLPPRLSAGTSLLAYSSFGFRIGADVNRTSTGRSTSSIRQGYVVLGPKC